MYDFKIELMVILPDVVRRDGRPVYQGVVRSLRTQAVFRLDNRFGSWQTTRTTGGGARGEPTADLAASLQYEMQNAEKENEKLRAELAAAGWGDA